MLKKASRKLKRLEIRILRTEKSTKFKEKLIEKPELKRRNIKSRIPKAEKLGSLRNDFCPRIVRRNNVLVAN